MSRLAVIAIVVTGMVTVAAFPEAGLTYPGRDLSVRLLYTVSGYSPERPFRSPTALALDGRNRTLYVADPGEHHIVAFSTQGVPVFVVQAGATFEPVAIAVDSDGSLLAADQSSTSIKIFDRQGNLTSELSLAGFKGTDPLVVSRIALGKDGRLYVVDSGNCQVLVFDQKRDLVLRFGERGDGEAKFKAPEGVAGDRFGRIYVSDGLADAPVQIFDARGKYINRFGRRGEGTGEHLRPAGIYVDRFDQLWVADTHRHEVTVYDRFGLLVRQFGEFGQVPGKLFHPVDVLVDGLGRVYVLEAEGRRLQVFVFDDPLRRFEP